MQRCRRFLSGILRRSSVTCPLHGARVRRVLFEMHLEWCITRDPCIKHPHFSVPRPTARPISGHANRLKLLISSQAAYLNLGTDREVRCTRRGDAGRTTLGVALKIAGKKKNFFFLTRSHANYQGLFNYADINPKVFSQYYSRLAGMRSWTFAEDLSLTCCTLLRSSCSVSRGLA